MYEEVLLVQDRPMRASAVGRVRTLESRLLELDFISRIIDAGTLEESLQILGESPDYQPSIGALDSPANWENALQAYLRDLVLFVESLAEKSEAILALRLKWDVHNAKIILKSTIQKPVLSPRLLDWGNWPIDVVRIGIEENKWEPPTDIYLAPIVAAGRLAFEQTKDIQTVELAMDRKEMETTISALPKGRPYFLLRYFQARIDLANLKTAVRLRNLKKEKQYAVLALAEGGTVSLSAYLDSWNEPPSSMIARLSKTNIESIFKTGSEDVSKESFLEEVEKAGIELHVQFAAMARRIPFGFPPVAGYLFAKENEVAILRAILAGKANGLNKDAIRRSLWT